MNNHILDQVFETIESRKEASADESYVASLFLKGREKIAEKVGEETIETIIEAIKNDKNKLAEESADLLFHLMILWSDANLKPDDIFRILEKRNGLSGLTEKDNRKET